MNHACTSNVAVSFGGNAISAMCGGGGKRQLCVRAAVDISPSEAMTELLHCYGPQHGHMRTAMRRKKLLQQYNFVCQCTACTQGDDSFAWFRCQEGACEGALRPCDREEVFTCMQLLYLIVMLLLSHLYNT